MHDGFTACPFALHIEPATSVTVDVCPLVWEHILKYKVQAGYLYLQYPNSNLILLLAQILKPTIYLALASLFRLFFFSFSFSFSASLSLDRSLSFRSAFDRSALLAASFEDVFTGVFAGVAAAGAWT
jgi:hypothetical protein